MVDKNWLNLQQLLRIYLIFLPEQIVATVPYLWLIWKITERASPEFFLRYLDVMQI